MANWLSHLNTSLGEPEEEYEVVVQPLIAPPVQEPAQVPA